MTDSLHAKLNWTTNVLRAPPYALVVLPRDDMEYSQYFYMLDGYCEEYGIKLLDNKDRDACTKTIMHIAEGNFKDEKTLTYFWFDDIQYDLQL